LWQRASTSERPAQVLAHGLFLEDVDRLEGARDAAPGDLVAGMSGDVGAVERNLAGGRLVVAGNDVEQRRFAGAVRTDNAEDFALVDGEGHVGDRSQAAEAFGQIVDLKKVSHQAALRSIRETRPFLMKTRKTIRHPP
jgi:hypothetical protein